MSTIVEVDDATKRRDALRRKLEYATRSEAQGVKLATLIRHIEANIEVAQQRREQDTREAREKLENAAQSDGELEVDKLVAGMATAAAEHQEKAQRFVRELESAKSLEAAVIARQASVSVATSMLVDSCPDQVLTDKARELAEELRSLESRRHETTRKLNEWKAAIGTENYQNDETYRKRVDRVVDTSQKTLVRLEQRIAATGQEAERVRQARAEY